LEGRQLQQKASHHEAIGKFLEALQQAEAFGAGRERVASTLNDLASAYSDLGDYRQAKKCSQRSLEISKQTGMEMHPGFLVSLNNLAMAHVELGQYHQAERLLRESVDSRLNRFGEGHPMVATSLMNLAGLCLRLQRYGEAETLYRRALHSGKQWAGKLGRLNARQK
jgi:tetratricopeptide (TPR) repeat protein